MKLKTLWLAVITALIPFQIVQAAVGSPPVTKEVTVLIYYSGDNRLSDFMHSSYLRVLREGASPEVNVVVQFDGNQPNDSFRVVIGSKKNGSEYLQNFFQKNVEYDMGNPQTLANFVAWGKASFPAKRTVLIISSHGFGVLNNPYPPAEDKSARRSKSDSISKLASSIDDTSHSFMSEEAMALELKKVLGNQKLDLLVHNSCLMGSLEALAIMASVAKTAITSEYSIYMNTNDDLIDNQARTILIEKIVSQFKQTPSVSEQEIGRQVVKDFNLNYQNFKQPTDQQADIRFPSTLAFYNLSAIGQLAQQYSKMALEFQAAAKNNSFIFMRFFDENLKARYVDSFGYIDLRALYKSLAQAIDPETSAVKMKTFDDLLSHVVLEKTELFTFQTEPVSHLHVFFPSILTQADLKPFRHSYSQIKTVQDHGWPQFLNFFWKGLEKNRDIYWLAKLQLWNQGETIIVKPTADDSTYDYDLFLELSMMAIRLRHSPDKLLLKNYLNTLNLLKRQSPSLDEHRTYIKSLVDNSKS